MAREANTDIWVRAVQASPPAGLSVQDSQCSIQFKTVDLACCPFCKKSVPTASRDPLSHIVCPTCDKQVLVPGRLGVFLLHDHIGEGEMGTIYRATDESLGREVDVKLVRIGQADAPESRERLTREACAAGKLNHPRVAQVYSLNFSEGHPYLVMELVPADFAKNSARGPSMSVALRMVIDVAEGFCTHRENLVRRYQTGQHRSTATATPSWLISVFPA